MKDPLYNLNINDDDDIINPLEYIPGMGVLQQAAYWAGVPVTVAALNKMIKERNTKITEQYFREKRAKTGEPENTRRNLPNINASDESEYYRRYDYGEKLNQYGEMVDTEIMAREYAERQMNPELLNELDQARGTPAKYRQVVQKIMDMRDHDVRTAAMTLDPDVQYIDGELSSASYEMSARASGQINEVAIDNLPKQYRKFVDVIKNTGFEVASTRRKGDGSYEVTVKTISGVTGREVSKKLTIPRIDPLAPTFDVFDPRTPLAVSGTGKLPIGVIYGSKNANVAMSGASVFLADITENLKLHQKDKLSIDQFAKVWNSSLNTNVQQVVQEFDTSSVKIPIRGEPIIGIEETSSSIDPITKRKITRKDLTDKTSYATQASRTRAKRIGTGVLNGDVISAIISNNQKEMAEIFEDEIQKSKISVNDRRFIGTIADLINTTNPNSEINKKRERLRVLFGGDFSKVEGLYLGDYDARDASPNQYSTFTDKFQKGNVRHNIHAPAAYGPLRTSRSRGNIWETTGRAVSENMRAYETFWKERRSSFLFNIAENVQHGSFGVMLNIPGSVKQHILEFEGGLTSGSKTLAALDAMKKTAHNLKKWFSVANKNGKGLPTRLVRKTLYNGLQNLETIYGKNDPRVMEFRGALDQLSIQTTKRKSRTRFANVEGVVEDIGKHAGTDGVRIGFMPYRPIDIASRFGAQYSDDVKEIRRTGLGFNKSEVQVIVLDESIGNKLGVVPGSHVRITNTIGDPKHRKIPLTNTITVSFDAANNKQVKNIKINETLLTGAHADKVYKYITTKIKDKEGRKQPGLRMPAMLKNSMLPGKGSLEFDPMKNMFTDIGSSVANTKEFEFNAIYKPSTTEWKTQKDSNLSSKTVRMGNLFYTDRGPSEQDRILVPTGETVKLKNYNSMHLGAAKDLHRQVVATIIREGSMDPASHIRKQLLTSRGRSVFMKRTFVETLSLMYAENAAGLKYATVRTILNNPSKNFKKHMKAIRSAKNGGTLPSDLQTTKRLTGDEAVVFKAVAKASAIADDFKFEADIRKSGAGLELFGLNVISSTNSAHYNAPKLIVNKDGSKKEIGYHEIAGSDSQAIREIMEDAGSVFGKSGNNYTEDMIHNHISGGMVHTPDVRTERRKIEVSLIKQIAQKEELDLFKNQNGDVINLITMQKKETGEQKLLALKIQESMSPTSTRQMGGVDHQNKIKMDMRTLALISSKDPVMAEVLAPYAAKGQKWFVDEMAYYKKFSTANKVLGSSNFTIGGITGFGLHRFIKQEAKGMGKNWKNYNPFLDNSMMVDPSNTSLTNMLSRTTASVGEDFITLRGLLERAASSNVDDLDNLLEKVRSGKAPLGIHITTSEGMNDAFHMIEKYSKILGNEITLSLDDATGRVQNITLPLKATENDRKVSVDVSGTIDINGTKHNLKRMDPKSSIGITSKLFSMVSMLEWVNYAKKKTGNTEQLSKIHGAIMDGMKAVIAEVDEYTRSQLTMKDGAVHNKMFRFMADGTFSEARSITTGEVNRKIDIQNSGASHPQNHISVAVGEALMTTETAMAMLLGSKKDVHKARRFSNHRHVSDVINRIVKDARGITDIQKHGIKSSFDITSIDKIQKLIEMTEVMGDTPDRKILKDIAKGMTEKSGRVAEGMIQGRSKFKVMQDFLKLNSTRAMMDGRDSYDVISRRYDDALAYIGDVKQNKAAMMINLQRQPHHTVMDTRLLSAKIDDNLKALGLKDRIAVSAADQAMTFGDFDGDLDFFVTKKLNSYMVGGKTNKYADALSDIKMFTSSALQRAMHVDGINEARNVRAFSYTAEQTLNALAETAAVDEYRISNVKDSIDQMVKNYAERLKLSKPETEKLMREANRFMDSRGVLKSTMFINGAVGPRDSSEEAIAPDGTIRIHDKAIVGYRRVYDMVTNETRSSTAAAKAERQKYEKKAGDRLRGIASAPELQYLNEDIAAERAKISYEKFTQKVTAGTPFAPVAKMEYGLHLFSENPKWMTALTKTMNDRYNSPSIGGRAAVKIDNSIIDAVSGLVHKAAAEELSLQAKHGSPNIISPFLEKLEELASTASKDKSFRGNELTAELPAKAKAIIDDIFKMNVDVELTPEDYDDFISDPKKAKYQKSHRMNIGKYKALLTRRIRTTSAIISDIGSELGIADHGELIHKMNALSPDAAADIVRNTFKKHKRKFRMGASVDKYIERVSSGESKLGTLMEAQIKRDYDVLAGNARTAGEFEGRDRLMMETWTRIQSKLRNDNHSKKWMEGAMRQWSFMSSNANTDIVKSMESDYFNDPSRRAGAAYVQQTSVETFEEMFGLNRSKDNTVRVIDTIETLNRKPIHGYVDTRNKLSGIGKGAVIGTMIAMGINQLTSGFSIPELAKSEGRGGEYWERMGAKESEMSIKPRAPRVQPVNPTAKDRKFEELEYRQKNKESNILKLKDHTDEGQDFTHVTRGIKIR